MFGKSLGAKNKNNFLSKNAAPGLALSLPFWYRSSCCSKDLTYSKKCGITLSGRSSPNGGWACQDDNAFRKRFHKVHFLGDKKCKNYIY
jgi:hypothetical protein